MALAQLFEEKKEQPINITPAQQVILKAIVFGEASGGHEDEVRAQASTLLNRVKEQGFEKAISGYSAYKKKSDQYINAITGKLNAYEKKAYSNYSSTVDKLISNPSTIEPWTHHENIKEYGEPSWGKGQKNYKDIGRQRFYVIKEK